MPECVACNETAGVIELQLSGDVTVSDLTSALESVTNLVQKTGYRKLLVDSRHQASIPFVGELYNFICKVSRQLVGVRQAVLVSDHSCEKMRFVDDVAFSKGITLKLFIEEEEALEWLNIYENNIYKVCYQKKRSQVLNLAPP